MGAGDTIAALERLKDLEVKSAQDGILLTEEQLL